MLEDRSCNITKSYQTKRHQKVHLHINHPFWFRVFVQQTNIQKKTQMAGRFHIDGGGKTRPAKSTKRVKPNFSKNKQHKKVNLFHTPSAYSINQI